MLNKYHSGVRIDAGVGEIPEDTLRSGLFLSLPRLLFLIVMNRERVIVGDYCLAGLPYVEVKSLLADVCS